VNDSAEKRGAGQNWRVTITSRDPIKGRVNGPDGFECQFEADRSAAIAHIAERLRRRFVEFVIALRDAAAKGIPVGFDEAYEIFPKLQSVALDGHLLFRTLFASIRIDGKNKDSSVLADAWLKHPGRIVAFRSDRIFPPWQLLYLRAPAVDRIDSGLFLGHQNHVLNHVQVTHHLAPINTPITLSKGARVLALRGASQEMIAEIDAIADLATQAKHEVLPFPEQTDSNRGSNALRRKWQQFKPHLVHAACHGIHDRLILKGGEVESQAPQLNLAANFPFENSHFLALDDQSRIECVFAFLNACSTNRSFLSCDGGMAIMLLKHLVYCVVSTECDIEDGYGRRFAMSFFDRFLGGESAVGAFIQARAEMMADGTPDSLRALAYSISSIDLKGVSWKDDPVKNAA